MERVPLGTRVRPLGINRATVADNCKCRAILLDEDPRMKYIAWDDERKRRVEVDQDMVIRFGLRPYTVFYYLIARLNTDMQGNIVGDQIVVEYLQLSENLNNEFADAVSEFKGFNSLVMTKVKKRDDKNRDLSYIKVIPASVDIPQSVLARVEEVRSTEGAIEGMWNIIDASTSLTKEQYLKILADEGSSDASKAIEAPKRQQPRQIQSSPNTSSMPQAPAAVVESFSDGEPFDDDFKDM